MMLCFRLSANESLINGHVTSVTCEVVELLLPGLCDCDETMNSCGRMNIFPGLPGVAFDAPDAFGCYNTSRLALRFSVINPLLPKGGGFRSPTIFHKRHFCCWSYVPCFYICPLLLYIPRLIKNTFGRKPHIDI